MADIRLKIGWDRHPKIRRLHKLLKSDGVLSLLRMWSAVSEYYAKGILTSLDIKDIADLAGWEGDPNRYVFTLVELKLLDFDGVNYSVHDWKEHQPWAYFSDERRESAIKAANAKWSKRLKTNMRPALLNASLPASIPYNAPSPSPSPSPEDNNVPYDRIVAFLNKEAGTKFRHTSDKTRGLIHARWKEGFRIDDFAKVIRVKTEAWKNDPQMVGFLRPLTLFGTKFESYLNEYIRDEVIQ